MTGKPDQIILAGFSCFEFPGPELRSGYVTHE